MDVNEQKHKTMTLELSKNTYAKCYRIEFGGQEIIPQAFENQYYSLGVIKLDYVHEK